MKFLFAFVALIACFFSTTMAGVYSSGAYNRASYAPSIDAPSGVLLAQRIVPSGYAAPAARYGAPSAPAAGYGSSASGYGAPSAGYGAPDAQVLSLAKIALSLPVPAAHVSYHGTNHAVRASPY